MVTPSGITRIEAAPLLALSSLLMVRDAVRMGVGALPLSLANADVAASRLVRWGTAEGPATALWALYPSCQLLNARVSAVLAHLKEAFPEGTPEELATYLSA